MGIFVEKKQGPIGKLTDRQQDTATIWKGSAYYDPNKLVVDWDATFKKWFGGK